MSSRPLRLRLLRHAQTTSNVTGALDTLEPGPPLTPLGERQAEAAAEVLTREPIEAVYVSRLVRTHQTVAPLAVRKQLSPVQLDGLEEVRAGDYEMATDRGSTDAYLSAIAAWVHGDLDARMPGGESGHEFLARYDAAIDRIVAAGHEELLVVSHGAAIRTWASMRMIARPEHPEETQRLDNTACITLQGHPRSGWELVDWHSDPIGGRFLEDEMAPDPTARPTG